MVFPADLVLAVPNHSATVREANAAVKGQHPTPGPEHTLRWVYKMLQVHISHPSANVSDLTLCGPADVGGQGNPQDFEGPDPSLLAKLGSRYQKESSDNNPTANLPFPLELALIPVVCPFATNRQTCCQHGPYTLPWFLRHPGHHVKTTLTNPA
eukprot:2041564-Pyramimonas_sp.AAC.2